MRYMWGHPVATLPSDKRTILRFGEEHKFCASHVRIDPRHAEVAGSTPAPPGTWAHVYMHNSRHQSLPRWTCTTRRPRLSSAPPCGSGYQRRSQG
eukprot:54985-Pleurochrysis_carterae.AAC.2